CYLLDCIKFTFNFLLFFFTSRRRHTRFSRDWSSDVCSSDLWRPSTTPCTSSPRRACCARSWSMRRAPTSTPTSATITTSTWRIRSEERRVGKSVDVGGGSNVKNKNADDIIDVAEADGNWWMY